MPIETRVLVDVALVVFIVAVAAYAVFGAERKCSVIQCPLAEIFGDDRFVKLAKRTSA